MPMYEYECTACGHRFERIRKFSDPPIQECPTCGEPKVQKLLSSPAIQFKGTGWYITDYAKKSGTGTDAKSGGSADGTKESKDAKDSKDRDSKSSSSDSKDAKESKESKSTAPAAGTTSTPKASGE